jgi:peptidoglycan hydrolase-like protein with peptidoglycan-binding domain
MLTQLRYGTAVLALLGATTFAFAASNNQPAGGSAGVPQNQAQQQPQNQAGTQALNLSSDQIRQVQQKLDQSGFHSGRIDGVLGSETENALRDFQKQKGLQQTGRPDNETLSALGVNGPAMQNVGKQNGASTANQSTSNQSGASGNGNSSAQTKSPQSSQSSAK